MAAKQKHLKTLEEYLPAGAWEYVSELIEGWGVHIKLTAPRLSKHGDYCKLADNSVYKHQITLNEGLPKESFLLTLVHEIAHMYAYHESNKRIAKHGAEWKSTFTRLMAPLLNKGIFSDAVNAELVRHMRNPAGSSDKDLKLRMALLDSARREGKLSLDTVLVAQLSPGDAFAYRGVTYIVMEKLRTRARARQAVDGSRYLFPFSVAVKQLPPKAEG